MSLNISIKIVKSLYAEIAIIFLTILYAAGKGTTCVP